MSISFKNSEDAPNVEFSNLEWQKIRDIDFNFASRLVQDARDLRNLTFKKTEKDLKSYEFFLQKKFSILIIVVVLIHLLLPLIEQPAAIEIPIEMNWIPCVIEIFCLMIYSIRMLHLHSFQTKEAFNSDKKNFGILIIIFLILIDVIQYLLVSSTKPAFAHRYTRFLRVFIFINMTEGKELRRAVRNVRKTLPDILNVFALFFLSILLFSFIGWNLFQKKPFTGTDYFDNFGNSLWNLYVCVTTSNYPDVMMPAYDYNGGYAIFFIIFLLVNMYMFLAIILATIYSNYKNHLKEEVRSTLILKRTKIKDAFDLLKQPINKIECLDKTDQENVIENVLSYESFYRLIKLIDMNKNDNQIRILFQVLDLDNNNSLSLKEFLYLPDLLNIRITEINDRMTFLEKHVPSIYNTRLSRLIINFVKHWIFHLIFDLLIFLNILSIVIDLKNQFDGRMIEWIFIGLFMLEILLKIYAYGIRIFLSSYWNIFDSAVIIGGFIAGILDNTNSGDGTNPQSEIFDVVLVLRSLRIIKFVASIKRFRVIISTIGMIIPSLLTYAMLLLTVYYVFSMVGMEIFGKVITYQQYNPNSTQIFDCNTNGTLKGTEFAQFRYCGNNFESFPRSFVLLFELMVVNQWHVLAQGFEDATQSSYTRIYFFAFHIVCVIICLNIFTAFVIEAFLLEYENQDDPLLIASKLEQRVINLDLNYDDAENDELVFFKSTDKRSKVTQLIDSIKNIFDTKPKTISLDEPKVKFHVNSKVPKAVEFILQRMFNDELDITDEDIIKSQNQ